jgi:RNA polymerase sigma-70 factor (ECF subfamily)
MEDGSAGEFDVVCRAQCGDRAALDELLRSSTPVAFDMLRTYTGSREDAADLLQEVLWEVWRSVRNLKDPSRYLSWLARVVHGKAVDHLRRVHRNDGAVSLESGLELGLCPSTDARAAFLGVLYQDTLERIRAAVRELPSRYREVLLLRIVDGLMPAEIAEQTGKRVGTVSSLVSRGMRKLRSHLGGRP